MTRDIRNRLVKALERGEVKSAGSALGPGMRRRLERALTGSGHEGGTPLPRIYSAGKMEEGGDRFPGQLDGKEIETPEGNVLRYRWSVPLKELAQVQDFEGASRGAGVLSVLLENPSLENFDLRRALFLDTETTGLAGGTGTYVILLGLGCTGVSMALWLTVISNLELSFAYPFVALSYVLITLYGWAALSEDVGGLRLAGVASIMVGVVIISRTEKRQGEA